MSAPDKIPELLHSMQTCIGEVKGWVTANMPKLNKTELTLITSKRIKHFNNLPTLITIDNAQSPFKQSVNNLGFTLEGHLNMKEHVSTIARPCDLELCCLLSIHRFLTTTTTATFVYAFFKNLLL